MRRWVPILSICLGIAGLFEPGTVSGQTARARRIVPIDASARQSFELQSKVAILVGVGAYPEGSGLSPLKYAAADTSELAETLTQAGYSVRQLKDSEATRGVIVRTLSQIGQTLDPEKGTLLFYFSGHGFAPDGASGANYLATYGTTVDDLKREGLSLPEVQQLMKLSKAKRQILWIDACRNDPQAGARSAVTRSFAKLDQAEGMRVLFSTREGSVSYEDDKLKHGVFTHFLLQGLKGEAAGSDGFVTFTDLANYVSDAVLNYGIGSGRIQRPFEGGGAEASGDFLVARLSSPPTNPIPAANPAPSQPVATSPAPGSRIEFQGVSYVLNGCSASGDQISCRLQVTSIGSDRNIRLGSNCMASHYGVPITIFDQSGQEYRASTLRIGGKSPEVYPFIRDIAVTVDLYFPVKSTVEKIPLLTIRGCQDADLALNFRDVSLSATLPSPVAAPLPPTASNSHRIENQGVEYLLERCSGSADQLSCRLKVTSLGTDRSIWFGSNCSPSHYGVPITIYDQSGLDHGPSTVRIGGKSPQVYFFVRDVAVTVDLDFPLKSNVAWIPLLSIHGCQDGDLALNFRNVSLTNTVAGAPTVVPAPNHPPVSDSQRIEFQGVAYVSEGCTASSIQVSCRLVVTSLESDKQIRFGHNCSPSHYGVPILIYDQNGVEYNATKLNIGGQSPEVYPFLRDVPVTVDLDFPVKSPVQWIPLMSVKGCQDGDLALNFRNVAVKAMAAPVPAATPGRAAATSKSGPTTSAPKGKAAPAPVVPTPSAEPDHSRRKGF